MKHTKIHTAKISSVVLPLQIHGLHSTALCSHVATVRSLVGRSPASEHGTRGFVGYPLLTKRKYRYACYLWKPGSCDDVERRDKLYVRDGLLIFVLHLITRNVQATEG